MEFISALRILSTKVFALSNHDGVLSWFVQTRDSFHRDGRHFVAAISILVFAPQKRSIFTISYTTQIGERIASITEVADQSEIFSAVGKDFLQCGIFC